MTKTSAISVNPVILSISSSCPSCASWLKNPFNQRNLCPRYPLLINDLRDCKSLYICKDTFTDVMSALQIELFLQNKAKFQKVKLNLNQVLTRDYDQMDTWSIRKNEPKTNPIEPKTNPILTNKTPIRTQFKHKQTQFKPKQTQFQKQNYTGRDCLCDKSTATFTKDNVNRNCFSVNPLYQIRKPRLIKRVDFLQHRVLIHIRVVFRIGETKLKLYT